MRSILLKDKAGSPSFSGVSVCQWNAKTSFANNVTISFGMERAGHDVTIHYVGSWILEMLGDRRAVSPSFTGVATPWTFLPIMVLKLVLTLILQKVLRSNNGLDVDAYLIGMTWE